MRKNLILTADVFSDQNWFLRLYFTLIEGIFSRVFGTKSAETESEKNATF